MEWDCFVCGFEQECDFPFGEDVECIECGAKHETDAEYSQDGYYGWVTGVVDL